MSVLVQSQIGQSCTAIGDSGNGQGAKEPQGQLIWLGEEGCIDAKCSSVTHASSASIHSTYVVYCWWRTHRLEKVGR